MKKTLHYLISLLTVTATLLLLTQTVVFSKVNFPTGDSTTETAGDTPLLLAFEQLTPPLLNGEGSGVRQVEPPAQSGTRILTDNNDFRIAQSSLIIRRQLAQSKLSYTLHLSQREQAGFYIYELCKLLI